MTTLQKNPHYKMQTMGTHPALQIIEYSLLQDQNIFQNVDSPDVDVSYFWHWPLQESAI